MNVEFLKKCSLGALKNRKAEIECAIIRAEVNEDLLKYRKFRDDLDLVNTEIALREKETQTNNINNEKESTIMVKEIKEFGSFETKDVVLKGCDMEISIPEAKLNEQLKQEVEEHKRIYKINSPEREKACFDVRIVFRTNHDLFDEVTGVRLYEWCVSDGEIVDQSFDDLDIAFSEESIAEIKTLVKERIGAIFS